MQWLNYHHLLYFWTAARLGSVTDAAAELRLAQPTLSGQIRALEDSLGGGKLFKRVGRNLALTDFGMMVYGHAERIFSAGGELMDAVAGRAQGLSLRFSVGIADVFPKMLAQRILSPLLDGEEDILLVCRENQPDRLLAELALHNLDVVLSDAPVPPTVSIKAYNHALGECGVTFFATKPLAAKLSKHFPKSLNGAPLLIPTENTTLGRSIEQWLVDQEIAPRIVGHFEDSALLKTFAAAGSGVFAAPSVIADGLVAQYGVHPIGHTAEIRERFYAITTDRRLKHPAVTQIVEGARRGLFSR
jgi:LysR family transcriptional activator of nhaA